MMEWIMMAMAILTSQLILIVEIVEIIVSKLPPFLTVALGNAPGSCGLSGGSFSRIILLIGQSLLHHLESK